MLYFSNREDYNKLLISDSIATKFNVIGVLHILPCLYLEYAINQTYKLNMSIVRMYELSYLLIAAAVLLILFVIYAYLIAAAIFALPTIVGICKEILYSQEEADLVNN